MERKLRHHIIEGLVLLALLVIFGPKLFTSSRAQNYIERVEPPAFPDKLNYDKSLTPVKLSTDSLTTEKKPLAIDKPSAWVIKLGSFPIKANAEALLLQLHSHNLRAFSHSRMDGTSIITRVYVGPVISHEQATKLTATIKNDLNLTSNILPFNPLEL